MKHILIKRIFDFRFVYKFVCDLRELLGYGADELAELVREVHESKPEENTWTHYYNKKTYQFSTSFFGSRSRIIYPKYYENFIWTINLNLSKLMNFFVNWIVKTVCPISSRKKLVISFTYIIVRVQWKREINLSL